jgi:hypothetical protein
MRLPCRDDSDYWQEIEQYIHKHTGTDFSHGICPPCMEKVLKEQFGDPIAAVPEDGAKETVQQ